MTSFEDFKQTFQGDIVDPSSPDYEQAIARWASNAVRKASQVFFPKDADDVAKAIKFAVANNIPFVIKGGGHNPSGASSIEGGISIDLNRYINYANVDPEAKTVDVGGGALWTAVDHAAMAHGMATVGGTVSLTGVGGLSLGGGFGALSGKHGQTVDNILEMTVVLADGSIVKASNDSNPDLYWALRGGGCNFGCVVNFKYQLHPQRDGVFAGLLMYPPAKLDEVMKVFDDWLPTITENDYAAFCIVRGPDKMPLIMVQFVHNGPTEDARRIYKPFYDLEPIVDTTGETTYVKFNESMNETLPNGRQYYMTGTNLRGPISDHGKKLYERYIELTEKHPADETLPPLEVSVFYEVFSLKKVMTVSPDAMAFRRGPYPNALVFVAWDKATPGDTETARSVSKEITSIIDSTAKAKPNERENEGYANYVSNLDDLRARSLKLWGDNYPKLQRIKGKYDPRNRFNKWVPIEPVLDT